MTQKTDFLCDEIDRWFEARGGEMADDLLSLINIRSVYGAPAPGAPYGQAALDALNFSRSLLKKLGVETRVFEDCIAVGETGPGAPELGILVHVDVVDANEAEWTSAPFRGVIRTGAEYGKTEPIIYGRGASDDKGPAVAAMYALRCALDVTGGLKKPAQILVGSAEEIGCEDVKRYIKTNEMPPNVFAPDANFPLVNVEKGRFTAEFKGRWERSELLPRIVSVHGGGTINIIPGTASAHIEGLTVQELSLLAGQYEQGTGTEITVKERAGGGCSVIVRGAAAHASLPQDGCNAQTALLSLLAALPLAKSGGADAIRKLAQLFPHGENGGEQLGIACSDDVSGVLTLGFDILTVNETGLTAAFDCRTPSVADEMDLPDLVRNALCPAGFAVEGFTRTSCHVTPPDSDFVRTLLDIYSEYTGDRDAKPLAMGGTTYVHGIPGGVAFGPELPGIDCRIHGRDEFIGVNHLILIAKMYAAAIVRICGIA